MFIVFRVIRVKVQFVYLLLQSPPITLWRIIHFVIIPEAPLISGMQYILHNEQVIPGKRNVLIRLQLFLFFFLETKLASSDGHFPHKYRV